MMLYSRNKILYRLKKGGFTLPQELTLEYINQMQASEEFIRDMEAYNEEFPWEPSLDEEDASEVA